MATIQVLKTKVTTNIPDSAGTGVVPKITPAKHREVETAIIDELKARGILASVVADLENLPGTESDMLFVSGYGLLKYVANGLVADNVTVFNAQDGGFWQLQKMFIYKKTTSIASNANLPVNLANGDVFKVSLDQNSAVAVPTGVKWDGRKIQFQFTQTGAGGFTPTFAGGDGGFAFSTTHPPLDLTGHEADSITIIEFEYSEDLDRWICTGANTEIVIA